MRINYRISDIADYINWAYFFHAWSMPAQSDESKHLKEEGLKMLRLMQPYVRIKCAVEIMPAYSEGDDVIVHRTYLCECGLYHEYGDPIRIPMLRQQTPTKDGYCLCLSDFIRPKETLKKDKIGIFATSVSIDAEKTFPKDDFNKMLLQTLADRLAEAGAEKLHEEVRKRIWGYAPHENLTISELHAEKFQGIRPAVGYPCLPDISINFVIDDLIGFKSIGVTLTEHAMMQPHASVSGFMLSHPKAQYFSVGKIDVTQARDYAQRRGMEYEDMKKYLMANINK